MQCARASVEFAVLSRTARSAGRSASLPTVPSCDESTRIAATLAASVGAPSYIRHPRLLGWVREIAALTQPERIHWCDGSDAEYDRLCAELVAAGTFRKLDAEAAQSATSRAPTRPTSRAWKTAPSSAATSKDDAGPTNNWVDPAEMRAHAQRPVRGLHARPHDVRGAVQHGPARLPIAHIGVELSDSPYVAVNMKLMTRMGREVLDVLGERRRVRAVPALGRRAARRGPEGRALAVQQGPQVHRAFSRDAGDLVLRLGLRRQRAARQEVPRAAHRLGHGRATRAGSPSTC